MTTPSDSNAAPPFTSQSVQLLVVRMCKIRNGVHIQWNASSHGPFLAVYSFIYLPRSWRTPCSFPSLAVPGVLQDSKPKTSDTRRMSFTLATEETLQRTGTLQCPRHLLWSTELRVSFTSKFGITPKTGPHASILLHPVQVNQCYTELAAPAHRD